MSAHPYLIFEYVWLDRIWIWHSDSMLSSLSFSRSVGIRVRITQFKRGKDQGFHPRFDWYYHFVLHDQFTSGESMKNQQNNNNNNWLTFVITFANASPKTSYRFLLLSFAYSSLHQITLLMM